MDLNISNQVDSSFWNGKRVFLTGHSGFKGSWLSLWLSTMGAHVCGYSLPPSSGLNLFSIIDVKNLVERSYEANINNLNNLRTAVKSFAPDIVIHMAAQSLVGKSYIEPIKTYKTNIMGTVNVLEVTRETNSIKALVVVTSDKCYENTGQILGYQENDPMGGYDPYSSSKGCAELITSSYIRSFFSKNGLNVNNKSIATVRAGNVIGGGDWAKGRIIPDAVRAFKKSQILKIRNPYAIRPWQHVLDPLSGYLILAQKLFINGQDYSGAWNFGPQNSDICTVKDLISKFIDYFDPQAKWRHDVSEYPYEANLLKLNCEKANQILGWTAKWDLENSIQKTAEWYSAHETGKDMKSFSISQIIAHKESTLKVDKT